MLQSILDHSNLEARPYQQRVCVQTLECYANKLRSVLIESPTGSGKTAMALLIAKIMQEKHDIGIGWVAMRRTLLKQAKEANIDSGVAIKGLRPISMFEHHPPKIDLEGRPIRMLVVDESQHDATDSMAFVHNSIRPDYVLGLTATPFRTDRVKLCFDKIIKDAGIHALIQQGYLSPYRHFTIDDWRAETVVDTYLREPERWGQTIIFFRTEAEAALCTNRINAAGIPAELVTASTDREAQIERFETGETRVLVNMFILTEGFDCPCLKTVFVRDSVKGPTIQMSGRVFRKYPGVSHKQVVQSKLTHWPMQRTATAAEDYVWIGDSWRSYKLSPQLERVIRAATFAQARIDTEIPTYIKDRMAKGPSRRPGDRTEGPPRRTRGRR